MRRVAGSSNESASRAAGGFCRVISWGSAAGATYARASEGFLLHSFDTVLLPAFATQLFASPKAALRGCVPTANQPQHLLY